MANPNSASQRGMLSKNDGRQRLIAIAAVVIIVLLGLNVFLLINTMKKGEENRALTSQLDESEQLKAELEKQYYQALSDLEEQRGRNEELNALIDQQKEDLKNQKERIEGMLGDNRRLREARSEIKRMSAQADQYLAEINQLKSENQELTARNYQLSETNVQLESSLESERKRNEALSENEASLREQKDSLEKERADLSEKVTLASVLKVIDLKATGQRIKNNGKATSRKSAKNVEQLEICFKYELNELAPPSAETFLIRIVNPSGETMALDQLGSGEFFNEADGQRMRYTQRKDFDYDQTEGSMCAIWAPGQPFDSGVYQVEIYNKGYLAGTGSFSLK